MKIVRFVNGGKVYHGQLLDHHTANLLECDLFSNPKVTNRSLKIEKLLAPLIPRDILCIGLNYQAHANETKFDVSKHPILFIKASNTLNDPGAPIPMPRLSSQIDYEGELAVVIGKSARNVPASQALDYVLGYTIANDVTARDWQRDKSLGGGQYCRGKGFDGFCPLGPWIVTADEISNPNSLHIQTKLNGSIMQDASTSEMIFSVAALIESLSSTMTLAPGAVILTGTPHGVGMARTPPVWMKSGDTVSVEIEGIGRLENTLT